MDCSRVERPNQFDVICDFGLTETLWLQPGTELMLDVHNKGRAVVSSGTREHAEFDVYRLHEHGLWATMQREDA
jgi:ATP-dependent Clp protease adapter protein ClpS